MTLLEKHKEHVDDFLYVCHWLADHRFVTSHGGNLAFKVEENV